MLQRRRLKQAKRNATERAPPTNSKVCHKETKGQSFIFRIAIAVPRLVDELQICQLVVGILALVNADSNGLFRLVFTDN